VPGSAGNLSRHKAGRFVFVWPDTGNALIMKAFVCWQKHNLPQNAVGNIWSAYNKANITIQEETK